MASLVRLITLHRGRCETVCLCHIDTSAPPGTGEYPLWPVTHVTHLITLLLLRYITLLLLRYVTNVTHLITLLLLRYITPLPLHLENITKALLIP